MRRLKKTAVFTAMLTLLIVITACRAGKDGQKVIEDASTVDTTYKVYYINKDAFTIDGVKWEFQSKTNDELVGECLEVLSAVPEEKKYSQPIEAPVEVLKYDYDENRKQVNVFFNTAYNDMDRDQELLCRAAVVKTLTQFDSIIDYVQFFVNNQALREADGKYMVMMRSDFVDSTSADLKDLNESTLKLYFASTDGQQLAQEDIYVHYYNTSPVERVVMESLLSGPLSDNLNRTFPEDTKINKTNVSGDTCYVDLNQRFLEQMEGQNFKVKIYSVVNSLCELESVDKVQILIDGQISDYSEEDISLGRPLTPNMDIVVKSADTPPALEHAETEETEQNDEELQ